MVDKRDSYTKEDLEASGRGELFGAGGPPLPAGNMLMMDRVVKLSEDGGTHNKGYVEAELDINPDLWFFGCHFIGDPVMPGCLGLDAMWQLVGFYLGWLGGEGKGRALGVGEVKFTGQVLPTAKKVTYRINFKRVITRKLIMGVADGEVLVDGEVIYTATDLKVGLFRIPQRSNHADEKAATAFFPTIAHAVTSIVAAFLYPSTPCTASALHLRISCLPAARAPKACLVYTNHAFLLLVRPARSNNPAESALGDATSEATNKTSAKGGGYSFI